MPQELWCAWQGHRVGAASLCGEVAGKASLSGPTSPPRWGPGTLSCCLRSPGPPRCSTSPSVTPSCFRALGRGWGVTIHIRVWWDRGYRWACCCTIYHRSWHIVSTQPALSQPVSECQSRSAPCSEEETWGHRRSREAWHLGLQAGYLRQMANRYERARWRHRFALTVLVRPRPSLAFQRQHCYAAYLFSKCLLPFRSCTCIRV